MGNFSAENVHFVELDPRVLDSLDSEPYNEFNDLPYENRRRSDSWQSHTTWQSDRPDGPPAANKQSMYSTSSFHSLHSDAAMERPSYSRSSIDSNWTGSSLPSTISVASHDFTRPGIPWNDMQSTMRSSNSISRLSSWSQYRFHYLCLVIFVDY